MYSNTTSYLQQISSLVAELRNDLCERHGWMVKRELLELGELAHARPAVLGGGAQQLEDSLKLQTRKFKLRTSCIGFKATEATVVTCKFLVITSRACVPGHQRRCLGIGDDQRWRVL